MAAYGGVVSVAAVLLVKDEADILPRQLRHLLGHVDEVILWDNLSSDGSSDVMQDFAREHSDVVSYKVDSDPRHYQSRKMTALALEAFEKGHRWVLPIDPDEIWYAPEGRTLRDWLDGVGRETQFVKAAIYNHVATALDNPKDLDPVDRIRWRQRVHLDIRWGKVACRCRPDLRISNGNHDANTSGVGTVGYGLTIRHFPYRSAEQFVRKSLSCYHGLLQATQETEGTGAHVRAYGKMIEEHGVEAGYDWFNDAFFSTDPEADDSLVYDPAP